MRINVSRFVVSCLIVGGASAALSYSTQAHTEASPGAEDFADCENFARPTVAGHANASAWSMKNFSDPHPAPAAYRYLIHGVSSRPFPKTVEIGLERAEIFASVIDAKKRGHVQQAAGFILSVSPENIQGTAAYDTAFQLPRALQQGRLTGIELEMGWLKAAERYQRSHGKIQDPRTLLAETQTLENNEVLLRGKQGSHVVRITGVFLRTLEPEWLRGSESRKEELLEFARVHALPVIVLDPP